MPELPEVQTVVSTLQPRITGRRILTVQLLRPDIVAPPTLNLPSALKNRRITELSRRGKRIVFTLDDRNRFYIHLGMTGQLTAEPASNDLRKHTHLILTLGEEATERRSDEATEGKRGGGCAAPDFPSSLRRSVAPSLQLRFRDPRRFGGIFWLGTDTPDDENMGPEPLTITPKELAAQLARTTRPIKSALLDQRLIAGLGNIYVDESLFASRIHPLTPSHKIPPDQVKTLCHQIKRILNQAIKARGSTLRDYVDGNGQLGTAQSLHKVYARETLPCPTCQTPIHRIVLTGRSTHFCPTCQPRG